MGAITIPALTGIDAGKAATLLVQFDAAAYSSAGGTVDNGDDHMDVTIKGPARSATWWKPPRWSR